MLMFTGVSKPCVLAEACDRLEIAPNKAAALINAFLESKGILLNLLCLNHKNNLVKFHNFKNSHLNN